MRLKHTGGAVLLLLASLCSMSSGGTLPTSINETRLPALSSRATSADRRAAVASSDSHYLADVCVQGMYQWPKHKLPIKVFVSSGEGVPGYRSEFHPMVAQAFDTWAQASGGRLSWKAVAQKEDADVDVVWTNQVTQRVNGTEAGETRAYTKLDPQTGRGIIIGAKMIFLTRLPERKFSSEDVRKTVLHEAGHALGLQGHSKSATDIMYYSINRHQRPVLTDRDVATINRLYADYPESSKIALK